GNDGPHPVMAALVAAINAFGPRAGSRQAQGVDARDKPGHDGASEWSPQRQAAAAAAALRSATSRAYSASACSAPAGSPRLQRPAEGWMVTNSVAPSPSGRGRPRSEVIDAVLPVMARTAVAPIATTTFGFTKLRSRSSHQRQTSTSRVSGRL